MPKGGNAGKGKSGSAPGRNKGVLVDLGNKGLPVPNSPFSSIPSPLNGWASPFIQLGSAAGGGGGGGATDPLTVINLATATQDDLDIDVTGYHRVQIVGIDCTVGAGGAFGSVSIDGSSYVTGAGNYRNLMSNSLLNASPSANSSTLEFMQSGQATGGVYFAFQMTGIVANANFACRGMWAGSSGKVFSVGRSAIGSTIKAAEILKVRLFTVGEVTGGTIYVRRIRDAACVAATPLDLSSDPSPSFVTVSGYDEVRFSAIDAAGGISRLTLRLSDDNQSTVEANVYGDAVYDAANAGAVVLGSARAAINFALDISQEKHAFGNMWGISSNYQGGMVQQLSGTSNSFTIGHIANVPSITDMEWHSAFDGVSLTSGIVYSELVSLQALATTAGTASAASSVTVSTTGKDEARGIVAVMSMSASDYLLLQVDAGSGYDTTAANYFTASVDRDTEAYNEGTAGARLFKSGTTNKQAVVEVFGLGAGMPTAAIVFFLDSIGGHRLMIYKGGTGAISNIRMIPAGAATTSGPYQFTTNTFAA